MSSARRVVRNCVADKTDVAAIEEEPEACMCIALLRPHTRLTRSPVAAAMWQCDDCVSRTTCGGKGTAGACLGAWPRCQVRLLLMFRAGSNRRHSVAVPCSQCHASACSSLPPTYSLPFHPGLSTCGLTCTLCVQHRSHHSKCGTRETLCEACAADADEKQDSDLAQRFRHSARVYKLIASG
jgi:hypothetical protein